MVGGRWGNQSGGRRRIPQVRRMARLIRCPSDRSVRIVRPAEKSRATNPDFSPHDAFFPVIRRAGLQPRPPSSVVRNSG